MNHNKLLHIFTLIILAVGFQTVSSYSSMNSDNRMNMFVRTPLPQKIHASLRSYNDSNPGETNAVWVFFTDKGFTDKNSFNKKAAAVTLTERTYARRLKVNREQIEIGDLPLEESYLNQIIALGGTLRRQSRWLNAASFDIAPSAIETIAALSFVAEIRPVARFKATPPPPGSVEKNPDFTDTLDYGWSNAVLVQQNIIPAHLRGLTGNGLLIGIFDTGFRPTHDAFSDIISEGRLLAEYDFVYDDANTANEAIDDPSAWNHGTAVWSACGGFVEGTLIGPAYGADYILAKTEDVKAEYIGEEDNWVAALEWADSIGVDIISSSVSYIDWYDPWELDGLTATITLASNRCDSLGILLVNSAGNLGPAPSSIPAPTDGFNSLSIGAVSGTGGILSYSSRGPTFDGRLKPELVATGSVVMSANADSDDLYKFSNGTSIATPIVAGAAALLWEAHPTYSPELIRLALMETASNASTPDNDIGYGIIDVEAALTWGTDITADTLYGDAPLTVNFTGNSHLTVTSWNWSFGDGNNAMTQNPQHTFTDPGVYDISLTVASQYGDVSGTYPAFIKVYGDTISIPADSAFAGESVTASVNLINSQPVKEIIVPIQNGNAPGLVFDSVSKGDRVPTFEGLDLLLLEPDSQHFVFKLTADIDQNGFPPPLPPGEGEILKLYFTIKDSVLGETEFMLDTLNTNLWLQMQLLSTYEVYTPAYTFAPLRSRYVLRCDADTSSQLDISDLLYLVDYFFAEPNGPPPLNLQAGDCDKSYQMDISDLLYLVDYFFADPPGPPPPLP